jgi:glucokinase
MTLLAGDVGGTKTVLALFKDGAIQRREVYPSCRYRSLEEMVREFLGSSEHGLQRACFGVAGPVSEGVCRATNLPWVIDARQLEKSLGIQRICIVNDFYALSIGIGELPPTDFVALNDVPSDPRGPWAVIGAGTGLGQAVLIKGPNGLEVLASEGGHTEFGPRNDLEIELLRFMLKRHGHVSYERLVSGPGLVSIYEFLREHGTLRESPSVRTEMEKTPENSPAIISSHGLNEGDPLCAKALDMFVSIWGAEAGNLALKVCARGGVYVAGGIAPKVLEKLRDGTFIKAFLDKGRLSHIVEHTAVKVVLNADAGLIGAAAIAARF